MQNNAPVIWVLADDRAGNVNQAVGVAEALELPFIVKNISYNFAARIPNFIKGASLFGVKKNSREQLVASWPDIVISAGRKTASVALYIKKQSGGKTKIVQIMWPSCDVNKIDLLVLPYHDRKARIASDNVVISEGAPNRISDKLLKIEREKWLQKFSYLPDPKIALLIGGSTKKGDFTEEMALELALKASIFSQEIGGSFLISASRRSNESVVETIKNQIKQRFYFYDPRIQNENPYIGYLALCDAIIVTGDSISMCSEACSTGKPVFIFAPQAIVPEKHKKFHKYLFDKGYAKPLNGLYHKFNNIKLHDATNIAEVIKARFL